MVFIYGIKVKDETQNDVHGRPLRFDHYDDAARAAASIHGARVVDLDWCASAPKGTVHHDPAASLPRPFKRVRPAA